MHRQHPASVCRSPANKQHAARVQAREAGQSECVRVRRPVRGGEQYQGGSGPRHKVGAGPSAATASC